MIYLGGGIKLERLKDTAISKIYENSLFNSVSNPAFKMVLQVVFFVCFVLALFESLLTLRKVFMDLFYYTQHYQL